LYDEATGGCMPKKEECDYYGFSRSACTRASGSFNREVKTGETLEGEGMYKDNY
jgi:hypothetical protein